MAFPLGALVNGGAVILGGAIGMLLGSRLPETMRTSVFHGLGLCTMSIGMQMTFKTQEPLYMIGSIIIGVVIGEYLQLEDRLQRGGEVLKNRFRSGNSRFTEGFVNASVLFCIGSMAIIGSLEEGLAGERTTVFTKTLLDFCASIAFGAVYGSGVMAAAVTIIIYQGLLTVFAGALRPYLTDITIRELSAVGGITILGIGINLLQLMHLRLANFLPALLVIVVLCLALG